MAILIICLFIACLIPYLTKLPLGYAMAKAKGGYNNNYPREQQATLVGFGARALGAHQNSFESLILFGIAVLTALSTNHVTPTVQGLAVAYIILRVLYTVFYLMNWATLRTSIWFLSVLASLTILCSCIP
ncbi:MAG: MAPEG family protein [Legionellales bacterium]